MCGQVRQAHTTIRPGMTLTVRHADGIYRQYPWGLLSQGRLIYNARQEELIQTWGRMRERVEIQLDGWFEQNKSKEWVYFDMPTLASGIIVNGSVLLITKQAAGEVLRIHNRQPALVV